MANMVSSMGLIPSFMVLAIAAGVVLLIPVGRRVPVPPAAAALHTPP